MNLTQRSMVALAVLISGCAGLKTAPPRPTASTVVKASPAALASAGATGTLPGSVATAAPLLGTPAPGELAIPLASSAPGGGIVSNNGSNISGQVLVPPGLIANNAAKLIANNAAKVVSNNGSNLISNNGGNLIGKIRFGVLATASTQPLAGALVVLLDAAGAPILGADGKPIFGVTDDQGRYTLNGTTTDRNALVYVDLLDQGQLLAIAFKGAASTARVDVDLGSTLVTGYVLDQFVKGQADPRATLDRLPATVAETTRTKTVAALATAGLAPTSVTAQDVVTAVNALRSADAGLDAQYKSVKCLLVAAGQCDLGAGQLGTHVDLGSVDRLVLAPDGALLIDSVFDGRIWRLLADGTLATEIGTGAFEGDDPVGKTAPNVFLIDPRTCAYDSQGRLVIVDGTKVLRVGQDRKVELLSAIDGAYFKQLFLGAGDEVQLAVPGFGPEAAGTLEALSGAAAPVVRFTFPTVPSAAFLNDTLASGQDGQHRLYFCAKLPSNRATQVARYDPATKAFEVLATTGGATAGLSVDPQGVVFKLDDHRQLTARTPDGKDHALASQAPPDFTLAGDAVLWLADGSAYVAQTPGVWQVKGGAFTRVIGSRGALDGPATKVTLHGPYGVALGPNGDLYVVEQDAGRVVYFPAGQNGRIIAGTGSQVASGNGGQASQAGLNYPSALRLDATGNVYFVDGLSSDTSVRKIDKSGVITQLYTNTKPIDDIAVWPDGSLAVLTGNEVVKVFPDGRPPKTLGSSDELANMMAMLPNGDLYLCGFGNVEKLTATTGAVTLVGKDDVDMDADEADLLQCLGGGGAAVGKNGKLYIASSMDHRITEFDPATRAVKVFAGPGGRVLAGKTVDDSVGDPYFPTLDPSTGDMLFSDASLRQIKRIPFAKF